MLCIVQRISISGFVSETNTFHIIATFLISATLGVITSLSTKKKHLSEEKSKAA